MIKYIKRKDLNVEKYDHCIDSSLNSRVYAFSWYLDIVADHWDVLVKGDYEAVMPLPWRQKYFIKYVYPPAWTQQLGVFSENNVKPSLIKSFIEAIPNKFRKVSIQFNSQSKIKFKAIVRENYILSLNGTYGEIRSKFRKDRKTRLNRVLRNNTLKLVKDISVDQMFELFRNYYSDKVIVLNEDYQNLSSILNSHEANVFLLGVYDENAVLLAASAFLKSKNRIVYLFSASSPFGKKQQCSTLIINSVIEKYAGSGFILDFEGSMIPGVASFYRSFGAKAEYYDNITLKKLPAFINFLRS